ncbi:hypothetical protein ERX46_07795 [Brumimicrobium glaciale]|uniref:Ppx/GppA phosphatase N-terminal domain-containing protein n=1 Tax=Brumimicrobium glaciale TaxID=200475 RepID=A0A4Q4KLE6_9FLAO|nr:hypothetical protein [Brumimicrobium glaciale]RYM33858.1 hypothetical protein ERX46_07795 [Brumimicrobium glaciale]
MRGAVIDLGTNTFGLIVFETKADKTEILITDKSFVNLGEGGINSNILTPRAMERAYFAIDHFVETCRSFGVYPDKIHGFGTSALRDATNAKEFLDKIEKLHQLKIRLINGKKEAELVYAGVSSIHPFSEESSCIMDIGGGSTEFTVTKSDIVQEQKSFNIGISRITQLFELSDPLTKDDINRIEIFLEYQTKSYFETLSVDSLIGAAGSFETFFSMINKTASYDNNTTHLLPFDKLKTILDELIHSTRAERDANYWIIDYRKEMINVAALKTKWVLDFVGATSCYFSPSGLKEGIIATAFKKK